MDSQMNAFQATTQSKNSSRLMELRVLHHQTLFWTRAHAAPHQHSPSSAPSVNPPSTDPEVKGYSNAAFYSIKVPLSQADVEI